jgi:hypothetical protein
MGASAALAANVAALALLEAILFSWEKRGGKLSLEWGLGALTALLGPRGRSVSRR